MSRWLRGAGVAVALGLGAVGVWLVVTGDTVKVVRVGTLVGLWGLLVGAFVIFGTRAAHRDQVGAASERPERKYDPRTEDILRREIRASIAREVGLLRAQVATLRSDVLDLLGPDSDPEVVRAVAAEFETTQKRLARTDPPATGGEPEPKARGRGRR